MPVLVKHAHENHRDLRKTSRIALRRLMMRAGWSAGRSWELRAIRATKPGAQVEMMLAELERDWQTDHQAQAHSITIISTITI